MSRRSMEARVSRFVEEYLVDYCGAQAAVRAGYSPNGAKVTASRLLTRPNVQARLRQRQIETAARLAVTRDDIIRGLLGAIEMAREQGDVMAMIRAAAEINKMLGFHAGGGRSTERADRLSGEDLATLSDAALHEIIHGGRCA